MVDVGHDVSIIYEWLVNISEQLIYLFTYRNLPIYSLKKESVQNPDTVLVVLPDVLFLKS